MPNCCVAAGFGNMPSDSVSLFRFPKDPHLCGVWTRQVQRTRANWKPSVQRTLQCRLLRRHSSVESKFKVFCTTYKRVLKSTAVPSIFKRNADVAEKKA